MAEYLYNQAQIDAAVKKSDTLAKTRPPKKVNEEAGDLEVKREIPMELFLNAVQGHGVDPQDTDYWKDMEKKVPSIKVASTSGKLFFGSNARIRRNFESIDWSKR